jgi:hypothetical protein
LLFHALDFGPWIVWALPLAFGIALAFWFNFNHKIVDPQLNLFHNSTAKFKAKGVSKNIFIGDRSANGEDSSGNQSQHDTALLALWKNLPERGRPDGDFSPGMQAVGGHGTAIEGFQNYQILDTFGKNSEVVDNFRCSGCTSVLNGNLYPGIRLINADSHEHVIGIGVSQLDAGYSEVGLLRNYQGLLGSCGGKERGLGSLYGGIGSFLGFYQSLSHLLGLILHGEPLQDSEKEQASSESRNQPVGNSRVVNRRGAFTIGIGFLLLPSFLIAGRLLDSGRRLYALILLWCNLGLFWAGLLLLCLSGIRRTWGWLL